MKSHVDVFLDGRSWFCPKPLAEMKRCLKTMQSGQIVRLETCDPSAHLDLLAMLSISQDVLLQYTVEKGVHCFVIKKI